MTGLDQTCYWYVSNYNILVDSVNSNRLSLTCAALLAHSYTTAIAYSRPIHTTVTAIASCAFLIVSASKAVTGLFVSTRTTPAYTELPLNDLSDKDSLVGSDAKGGASSRHQGKVRISILVAAITILSVRLELYRQISKKTECTVSSLEIYVPLLIACYDALRFQKSQPITAPDKPHARVYDRLQGAARQYVLAPRFRYVLPTAAFCLGCRLLLIQWLSLNSTYICPVILRQQTTIPSMQIVSFLLDTALAIIVCEMLPRSDGTGLSSRRSVVLWSTILTGTAIVWCMVSVIVYFAKPELQFWLLLLDSPQFFGLITSITLQSILFSILCITTMHSVSPIPVLPELD